MPLSCPKSSSIIDQVPKLSAFSNCPSTSARPKRSKTKNRGSSILQMQLSLPALVSNLSFAFLNQVHHNPFINTMEGAVVDALIIGGGPAGLSTALTLARQARSSIVFDSGSYRNDATENMHMLLGFDHASPSDFRAAARDNIASRYDFVTFKDANVQSVKKLDNNLFEVTTEGQQESWRGRKLILATGVEDIMLDIEGYSECWGKSMYVENFEL